MQPHLEFVLLLCFYPALLLVGFAVSTCYGLSRSVR